MEASSSAAHQGAGGLPAGAGLLLQGAGGALDLENACLDLFLLDLAAPPQQLRDLLAAAWDQDALTALRLVCARRYTGESAREREGFLTAALWMLQTHPRSLAANLAAFADFGYIQDFPELLHRLVAAQVLAPAGRIRKRARDDDDDGSHDAHAAATSSSSSVPLAVPDVPPPAATTGDEAEPQPQAAVEDAPFPFPFPFGYRILYDAIVDFFVDRLRSDLDHLNNRNPSMIGLAAKWCSSLDSPLGQTTLLHKDIVRRLFPDDCSAAATDHHLLGLLRRKVLVPLITAQEKQPRTSSSLSQGQGRQQAAKLPHQIAANFGKEAWGKKSDTRKNRAIEEWRSMVDGLRARGCLRNCIVVCDMTRGGLRVGGNDLTRLQVCVALGLLIPELSDRPWRNWVHVFSSRTTASIRIRDTDSYADKVAAIREMQCDDRFNLTKVFQWVLSLALEAHVPPAGMVKNIVVLTGRDFDQATVAPTQLVRPENLTYKRPSEFDPTQVRRWRDEYRIIKDMFHDRGYTEHVPGVVFWNLRGEPRSAASTWVKDGVMSLSGYSDDLMRLFLDKSGVVEPDDEMYAAISGEEYQKLKAVDDD